MNQSIPRKYKIIGAIIALIVLCVAMFFWGQSSVKIPESETIVKVDTVLQEQPKPKDSIITKVKFYPVVKHDTVYNEHVSIREDNDSLKLQLIYSQKHYKDSIYEAWVSGVDPAMDSIKVYKTTITRILKEPAKHRINLSFSSSYNYNIPDKANVVRLTTGVSWVTPKGLAVTGGYFIDTEHNHGPEVKLTYSLPLTK